MDLRIGVTQSPREVSVELPDDTDREALKAQVEAALTGAVDVLWVTDKKNRQVAVSAAKIAYVEIGTAEGDRKIGFGG
jgi:hypothetical protein